MLLATGLAAGALSAVGCGSGGDGDAVQVGNTHVSGGPSADWPVFGRVTERTHSLTDAPNPPFRQVWQLYDRVLIEFPPALANGVLYVGDKLGEVRAIDSTDGHVIWTRQLGGRDVTAPAFSYRGEDKVMVGQEEGDFQALDFKTGKPAWKFHTSSPIESSPIVVGATVYFGTDDGTVYALDVDNGKQRWKYKAAGPVKSSPSFSNGLLYFADYRGDMYAARPSDGKLAWRVHTGSGGFYSSPTIAYGRVYAARDDGTVVAVSAKGGKAAWQRSIGNGVYGSPAVAQVKGVPPSVYIGGYAKKIYALDAGTGKPRWSHEVGGPIPGTATVVGHTVYTSSFQTRKTLGLDAGTGKEVFHFPSAGYTPAISDGQKVYLIGYLTIWALAPKS
jgi:outer membrane protein assembly factor BamB